MVCCLRGVTCDLCDTLARWNPALEDQCADRIHRIGQLHPCSIKHLQVDDSMDTALLMIQVYNAP
jgi:hypothetical protein